ncbi:response regulator [Brevibacterium luteolum]|uniref:Response regulator transcription factor n=1 Tax=Brevibacterium luteolum TaxID=199591 RepID=A0A6G8KZ36_9MICO|nr:response regulator transcription factor [Brevibacterium luteolum]QIN29845.1 response regulator transcription factor [Brevibacterium luteolum]
MITIGLADDEPLFTAGLAMILDAQPDMRVLWQAIDGADAIRKHNNEVPDILLLDIQMPALDGLAATQRLVAASTSSKIIILTTFDTDEYVLSAIESGASGFLLKNTAPDDVVAAIRTVHDGDAVISPGPTRRLFTKFRKRQEGSAADASPTDSRLADEITPRERDILALIARGRTNQEICDELWLTMPTIKTHIGNLRAKTQSRDRVQLALFALRVGIAELA